jgi:uncharacterized protein (TIGR02145 family)
MKRLLMSILSLALFVLLFSPNKVQAQSPEKFSYQAVVHDALDQIVQNTTIGMQISVIQGTVSGSSVYVETQTPTTDVNGLVSLEIGGGTNVSGDFSTIDWANGPYFIKTEIDLNGGTTYTISGTAQMLSVPYALYAKSAGNGEADGTESGQMKYWDGTAWVTVATTQNEGATLQMIGGVPTWTGGTPPSSTPNVTNPTTGKIWMDRNLGATQIATSFNDVDSYGDLYQWGRAADGHESRTSALNATLATSDTPGHGDFITTATDWRSPANDNLWQGASGTNNPCPSAYRLPTQAEWDAEVATWSSANYNGAFDSALKLPVSGYRKQADGVIAIAGTGALYWSSTVSGTDAIRMIALSSKAETGTGIRGAGMSVRCIKD